MRFIVRLFKSIGNFLDHRFPEKMTVDEVRQRMDAYEKRIHILEDQHNKIVLNLSSLKLMTGIKTAMQGQE